MKSLQISDITKEVGNHLVIPVDIKPTITNYYIYFTVKGRKIIVYYELYDHQIFYNYSICSPVDKYNVIQGEKRALRKFALGQFKHELPAILKKDSIMSIAYLFILSTVTDHVDDIINRLKHKELSKILIQHRDEYLNKLMVMHNNYSAKVYKARLKIDKKYDGTKAKSSVKQVNKVSKATQEPAT